MKKTKYIALILVLAFGLIGGAYAAWGDKLYAHGTVATGDVDVIFTNAVSNDPGETLDPASPEGDEKNVGSTEVKIVDEGKALQVTIDNAYPGYVSCVAYELENKGTVPVICNGKNIAISNETALEVENFGGFPGWGWGWGWGPGWGWGQYDPGCNDDPEPVEPEPILEVGSQLHEGKTYYGSICHTVTGAAKQGKSYTYKITYDFIQWNLSDVAAIN
jgi:hypothetical protein